MTKKGKEKGNKKHSNDKKSKISSQVNSNSKGEGYGSSGSPERNPIRNRCDYRKVLAIMKGDTREEKTHTNGSFGITTPNVAKKLMVKYVKS